MSRLGILRQAEKIMSRGTSILLYDSFVLPLFNYYESDLDSYGA